MIGVGAEGLPASISQRAGRRGVARRVGAGARAVPGLGGDLRLLGQGVAAAPAELDHAAQRHRVRAVLEGEAPAVLDRVALRDADLAPPGVGAGDGLPVVAVAILDAEAHGKPRTLWSAGHRGADP